MKIEELTINPDNHHLFDIDFDDYDATTKLAQLLLNKSNKRKSNGKTYTHKDILNINIEINEYFDFALGERYDWGGRYATWLSENGFDANIDNRWWSKEAVNPFLIKSFVESNLDT